jgi:acetyl esterase
MKPRRVWEEPGPAQAIYAKFAGNAGFRDQWVADLRKSWGNPHHADLALFPEVREEPRTYPGADGGIFTGITLRPPEPNGHEFVYLHGGGWVSPLSGKHRAWARRISALSGQTVHCIEYRLAPEHPFPIPFEDCLCAYTQHRAESQGRIAIGGDSAGGNLGLAVALHCAADGKAGPDAVLALSPVTDFYFENYEAIERLGVGNPLADMSLLAFERFCYLPHRPDWDNPLASPMLGKLETLPNLFVLAGGHDPLHEENLKFARMCEAAGVPTTVHFDPDMPHSFHTHHDVVPGHADAANQAIVRFLTGSEK